MCMRCSTGWTAACLTSPSPERRNPVCTRIAPEVLDMFRNRRSVSNTQLMDDINSSGLKRHGDPMVPERTADWSPEAQATEAGWDEPLENQRAARSALETAAHLAGRTILGGYFVYNGINHFRN